jgi:hypothetical protein
MGLEKRPSLTDSVCGQKIAALRVMFDYETRLPTDVLHGVVLGQDVADNPSNLFLFADVNQTLQHFGAKAQAVPSIADNQGEFGVIGATQLAQSSHTQNLRVRLRVHFVLGHQRDFAVVVIETNPQKPLVCDALGKF